MLKRIYILALILIFGLFFNISLFAQADEAADESATADESIEVKEVDVNVADKPAPMVEFSMGLKLGMNPGLFDLSDMFLYTNDYLYKAKNNAAGVLNFMTGLGASENFFDGPADIEESSGGPIGFQFEVDAMAKIMGWAFARIGFRYQPPLGGGAYTMDFSTVEGDVSLEATFGGWSFAMPITFGVYIPFLTGGVYAGLGPGVFAGAWWSEMTFEGPAAALDRSQGGLFAFDADATDRESISGRVKVNDAGVGLAVVLGFEQEIMENLSLFFNFCYEDYKKTMEVEIPGSMNNPTVHYFISKRAEAVESTWYHGDGLGEDAGHSIIKYPIDLGGTSFGLGVRYKIF